MTNSQPNLIIYVTNMDFVMNMGVIIIIIFIFIFITHFLRSSAVPIIII